MNMKCEDFVNLYKSVVDQAKKELHKANANNAQAGTPEDWPAGQQWHELGNSSKGYFMSLARQTLGIDNDEFLNVVRNWPYDDLNYEKIEQFYTSGNV